MFQGAYVGLITGLVFMFWIGVGAYITKPYIPRAIISTAGCNWNLTTTVSPNTTLASVTSTIATTVSSMATNTTLPAVTKSLAQIQEEEYEIYCYHQSLSPILYWGGHLDSYLSFHPILLIPPKVFN